MVRPLVGITLDWVEQGSFSVRPHYALREHYFSAVWAAGGLPVAVPLIEAAQDDFLARVDGILVPGGDYPSPGWWYGDDFGVPNHPRADLDVALIRKCLALDKPFFGICAGMQTLAVALGGRLHWSVKDKLPGALDHRDIPLEKRAHEVVVEPGSVLASFVGNGRFMVNSHHNEGVATVGDGMISAKAEDGVIEAMEVPGKRFALGVQWHPEMFTEAGCVDRLIFDAFVEACR